MSHLSSMRTCLSNLTLLEHSLTVLGINWYRENYSHVVIPQDNGHDFGFFWNGREFEFIGDELLWIQAWSIGTFIEKVQYQYPFEKSKIIVLRQFLKSKLHAQFLKSNFESIYKEMCLHLNCY